MPGHHQLGGAVDPVRQRPHGRSRNLAALHPVNYGGNLHGRPDRLDHGLVVDDLAGLMGRLVVSGRVYQLSGRRVPVEHPHPDVQELVVAFVHTELDANLGINVVHLRQSALVFDVARHVDVDVVKTAVMLIPELESSIVGVQVESEVPAYRRYGRGSGWLRHRKPTHAYHPASVEIHLGCRQVG